MKDSLNKIIFIIFTLALMFSVFNFVSAQENQVKIDFFYSPTCPHCAKEKIFLNEIKEKYPEIEIKEFSVSKKENLNLLLDFYKEYDVPQEKYGLVPVTFIESQYFVGFNEEIKSEIENCILGQAQTDHDKTCQCQECSVGDSQKITLPLIGQIDASKYSLPVLSVVLGTLDGFNFCSLGALVLILGLVLALRSRKKVLIFGGAFILITAIVYGILIVVWYQIFSILTPYLKIMEILIGLLGIGAGIYFFRQFLKFRKYGPTCEIDGGKKIMSKFSSKFQQSLDGSGNILLLTGLVLMFAAIITVVEFPCSAAVPVVFAGILANSQLPAFSYLLYIILFLVFYMLDEIIVFLIAFFTMKIWLAGNKAITWITLIEAVILFGLGLYYLFGFSVLL